jgi:hypothetical protein
LDIAVDRLIEDVSTKVLGKRKPEDDDGIAVHSGVELPCNIFNRLRPGEWFNAWTIRAAMDICDKPFFVKYGHSVPLDEEEPFGRNGTKRRITRPLARWGKQIKAFRSEAQERYGNGIRLIYFCPLNHNNKHYTLLVINEREEKICHYDSMADEGVIDGTVKVTRVGKLVQVSDFPRY